MYNVLLGCLLEQYFPELTTTISGICMYLYFPETHVSIPITVTFLTTHFYQDTTVIN